MLVDYDKNRNFIKKIFAILFIVVAIIAKLNFAAIILLNTTFRDVFGEFMPHKIHFIKSIGSVTDSFIIVILCLGIILSLLYFLEYRVAIYWLLISLAIMILAIFIFSAIFRISLSGIVWKTFPALKVAIQFLLLCLWNDLLAIRIRNKKLRLLFEFIPVFCFACSLVYGLVSDEYELMSMIAAVCLSYSWWGYICNFYLRYANAWNKNIAHPSKI